MAATGQAKMLNSFPAPDQVPDLPDDFGQTAQDEGHCPALGLVASVPDNEDKNPGARSVGMK